MKILVFLLLVIFLHSLINTLVSKCNRMMGMIKRSVGYKAPISVTSDLYSALVCSNLEHFYFFNEIQALESFQWALHVIY